MKELRTETSLQLCISPLYNINDNSLLKLCYLNARSLHKHIEDVRKDFNYSSTHVTIFTETRFSAADEDEIYKINDFELFRNDSLSIANGGRPYGGTAVYSRVPFVPGYPYSHNLRLYSVKTFNSRLYSVKVRKTETQFTVRNNIMLGYSCMQENGVTAI